MKIVLITGANGALGHAVTALLSKEKHYRVVATNHNRNNESNCQLDVSDRLQTFSVLNKIKPDLVLHLAATYTNEFKEAYAVNVEGARHLLDAVQEFNLHTRILLIGTAAEYGAVLPEENPIHENHVLKPISIYGLTKTWQTQLSGLYASRGLDVIIARVFNLDGPGISERLFVGRLQKQIDEVLKGQKSVIELGPLNAIRDYLSISDACDQILAIAEQGKSGRVYHVASGKPIKMSEILTRYLSIHKLDKSIVSVSDSFSNRKGYDVPVIYADITSTLDLMKAKW